MDNIDLLLEGIQWCGLAIVKDIHWGQKGGLQRFSIEKQIIPQFDKPRLEIRAERILGGGSVGYELSDVLAEAASEIQERLAGFKSRDDAVVGGILGDREVEESEDPDTGVREDFPGFFAL